MVANGATTIAALKACTKAGSTCGGCVPLVTQVMKAEMARSGMVINNHVCEHPAYARQQRYPLVRLGNIRSFDGLLARHRGPGLRRLQAGGGQHLCVLPGRVCAQS